MFWGAIKASHGIVNNTLNTLYRDYSDVHTSIDTLNDSSLWVALPDSYTLKHKVNWVCLFPEIIKLYIGPVQIQAQMNF